MHHQRSLLLALVAGTPAISISSQQTLVSPAATATVEGSTNNVAPFGQSLARRYVQIHSDLGLTPKFFTKLAFRKNGGSTATTGTCTVDLELNMGNAVPWDRIRYLMSSNFIGPKTNVIARKVVVLGPSPSTGMPTAFDVTLLLDAPYLHIGVASMAWEALVYSNTISGSAPSTLDADAASSVAGTSTITGAGCTASGQALPMYHTVTIADVGGAFTMGGFVDFGPANAPVVLYVGTTTPNQSVPGLCSPLLTNLVLAVPLGTTDGTGYLGSYATTTKYGGGAFAFVLPNTFPGAILTTQAHALDSATSHAIPVANSDGRTSTVPNPSTSKLVMVSRAYNDVGGTTAEVAKFAATGFVGFCLVTEFTY